MLRSQALSRTTAAIVRVGSVPQVGTMRTIGLTTLCFVGGFFAGATFVFAIGMLLAAAFAIDGPYEALLQKQHLSVERSARSFPRLRHRLAASRPDAGKARVYRPGRGSTADVRMRVHILN